MEQGSLSNDLASEGGAELRDIDRSSRNCSIRVCVKEQSKRQLLGEVDFVSMTI